MKRLKSNALCVCVCVSLCLSCLACARTIFKVQVMSCWMRGFCFNSIFPVLVLSLYFFSLFLTFSHKFRDRDLYIFSFYANVRPVEEKVNYYTHTHTKSAGANNNNNNCLAQQTPLLSAQQTTTSTGEHLIKSEKMTRKWNKLSFHKRSEESSLNFFYFYF